MSGICIPIIGPVQQDAQEQIRRALGLADLIEIRVDLLKDVDLSVLMAESSLPILLTLRSKQHGGRFEGSREEYESRLLELAKLKPAYLDIEDFPLIHEPGVVPLHSYHDFGGLSVPSMIDKTSLVKIAALCGSGVEAMKLAQLASPRVLAVGMGEDGMVARVLSAIRNAPFTFAALDDHLTNAPGQPTVSLLRQRYRYQTLSSSTQVLGLVGERVAHSMGMKVHNAAFEKAGIDAVYLGLRVDKSELVDFFQLLSSFPFVGLSVTMPHKQAILPHLDDLDEVACAIGAVNTVGIKQGKFFGTNTDAGGALNAIEAVEGVEGKRLVVIGAGGAARAIIWEAIRRGADVTVVNRSLLKAKEIASLYGCAAGSLDQVKGMQYDILVQATSVGMAPAENELPIDPEAICSQALVMDIVTTPPMTRMLREAQSRGCRIIQGQEMWIFQAALQLAFWFPEHFTAPKALACIRSLIV